MIDLESKIQAGWRIILETLSQSIKEYSFHSVKTNTASEFWTASYIVLLNDQVLLWESLLVSLYFDEFEEELQAIIPEPENPDYDQRKAADASGGQDTGLALEEEDPL